MVGRDVFLAPAGIGEIDCTAWLDEMGQEYETCWCLVHGEELPCVACQATSWAATGQHGGPSPPSCFDTKPDDQKSERILCWCCGDEWPCGCQLDLPLSTRKEYR